MLQSIRDRSQGWVSWLIILVLAVAFGLFGIQYYLSRQSVDKAAITIDGTGITQKTLDNAYMRLRGEAQAQQGQEFVMTPALEKRLKKQALQQVVVSNVLSHQAYESGLRISNAQVESAITQMPAFQVGGRFSEQRFRAIMSGMMYSTEDFMNDMRAGMLINQLQQGIRNSAFVTTGEISNALSLLDQTRDIRYVVIPASRFRRKVKVTSQQIRDYYQKHMKTFMIPAQIKVDYLSLSVPGIMQSIRFSSEQLKKAYQDNLDNFTSPAKWRLSRILIGWPADASAEQKALAKKKSEAIYQQLRRGKSFSSLARRYATVTAQGTKNGDMGWVTASAVSPEVMQALQQLKAGAYTQPIKTFEGYVIVRLRGYKKSTVTPFAAAKGKVRRQLASQQAEQRFADLSDQLANAAFANPQSLQPAAKALKLAVKTTPFFTRQTKNNAKKSKTGSIQSLINNPRVIQAAFSDAVLQQRNNSDLIQLSPQQAVVLRLNQYMPAKPQPLAMVRTQIRRLLIARATQKQAQQFVDNARKALQENQQSLLAVAKQFRFRWKKQSGLTQHSAGINPVIVVKAFSLPRPQQGKAQYGVVALPQKGYALVALMQVNQGKPSARNSEEYTIFKQEMANSFGAHAYELYVRSAIANATIKPESIKRQIEH